MVMGAYAPILRGNNGMGGGRMIKYGRHIKGGRIRVVGTLLGITRCRL